MLWTFLSDLGHVDFFLEGSQRWRVRAPALAGLLPPARSAVLTGGRTPRLLATLADGAAANGCRVRSDGAEDRPACIHVDGDPGGLLAAAGAAGIPFIESYASVLSGLIDPIPRLVETAKVEEGPANWSVRSFDFDSLAWVEGLRERSACERVALQCAQRRCRDLRQRSTRLRCAHAGHGGAYCSGQPRDRQ